MMQAPNATAAAAGAAVSTIALYFLHFWSAWAQAPAPVQGAASSLIVAAVAWLGGWLNHRHRTAAAVRAAQSFTGNSGTSGTSGTSQARG